MTTFAIAFEKSDSGCSAVRLAHLLWEQGVVGSNPATPTIKRQAVTKKFVAAFFLFVIMKSNKYAAIVSFCSTMAAHYLF